MRRFRNLLTVGFLFVAACGGGDERPATQAPPEEETARISVTANEYAFQNPASLNAGAVEFNMTNRGKEQHVMELVRVNDGSTLDEAKEYVMAPEPQGPEPYTFVPGVALVVPGGVGNSMSVLEPGTYMLFCPIPAPDGTPHFAKGMISSFEATGSGGGSLPQAEATVTGQEFAFLNAPQLSAGEHVVSFRNAGKQEHELVLAELLPGKTVDDVVAFFRVPPGREPGTEGAPPMKLQAGPVIQPGLTAAGRFRVEAGKQYAFICTVPDFSDDPPIQHIVKGMYTQAFTAS